jgi:hypothetical protein
MTRLSRAASTTSLLISRSELISRILFICVSSRFSNRKLPPARRKRGEAERTALKEAAVRLQQVLTAEGISEEEILNDFKRWRAGGRK